MCVEIKIVGYNAEVKYIREIVFQQEQGVAPELEFDGEDETSEHLVAYLDDQPVGTARIRYLNSQRAKIERLAVLPMARGKGIGTQLMIQAMDLLKTKNYHQALIHSQIYVKSLYEKLGFEQRGDCFVEAGIDHIKMIKNLADDQ